MNILSLLLIVGAYFLGSVSSAIVVCRLMNLPDPRLEGSKNPGTTNVLRIGGKIPAMITLVGDVLKGTIPVIIAKLLGLGPFAIGLVGVAALIGHLFPIFFGFEGGKGVATAIGAIIGISTPLAIIMGLTWAVIALLSRYSSLSSLVSVVVATIVSPWIVGGGYFLPILIMAMLLFWRHQGNIQRLLNGTESKLGNR